MLFRVIQEGIQNVLKHAYAGHVLIEITTVDDTVTIRIQDDGRGFQPESTLLIGMGLHHMQNRTNLLGGRITWNSEIGKGAEVVIVVPIKTALV
jgi:signal transduction histidine kinase